MAEAAEDGRYAYLLQPVKDLERNFAIDLVTILNEYCAQLQEIADQQEFEVDNGHRFNFAEAAMLVQGTVTVFGRKVDLVHQQALNFFTSLQKSKKTNKKGGEDCDDEGVGDDDDDFSPSLPVDPALLVDYSRLRSADPMSLVLKAHRAEVPTIPLMPMSLMPLADFEKCNVPMYSRKNCKEIIGKKDDFKINTGYVGRKGALLLDLLNDNILDSEASEEFLRMGEKDDAEDGQNEADSGRCSPDDDDDMCGGGDNFGDGPIGDVPRLAAGLQASAMEDARRLTTAGATMLTFTDARRTELHRPSTVLLGNINSQSQKTQSQTESTQKSPWCTDELEENLFLDDYLDGFEDVAVKRKPLEVIRCFVNATQVRERQRKTESKGMTMKKRTMQTIDYINEHFYLKSKCKINSSSEEAWQNEALFPYRLQEQKRRAAARRERNAEHRRQQVVEHEVDFDDDGFDNDVPAMGLNQMGTMTQGASLQEERLKRFDDIANDDFDNSIALDVMGEDLGELLDLEDRPRSQMSLQDILQFHMIKYWTSREEATSKLAGRVQEWDERMQPILEEEETRKEFDVHEYGNEMLTLFDKAGERRTFPELLKGKEQHEISRYFLSCLMMANTYNLKLEDAEDFGGGEGEEKANSVQLTLLKKDRHHEVFDKENVL